VALTNGGAQITTLEEGRGDHEGYVLTSKILGTVDGVTLAASHTTPTHHRAADTEGAGTGMEEKEEEDVGVDRRAHAGISRKEDAREAIAVGSPMIHKQEMKIEPP